MQEKQLVQQQALEQAQQNEQLRAQVRWLMLLCVEGSCAEAASACQHNPNHDLPPYPFHIPGFIQLVLVLRAAAGPRATLPSMALLTLALLTYSNRPLCPLRLPPLPCLQVSGLSQRCGQEQSFRQELRGSLQALAHSIGAAPVSPPMELCQDFLGRE